MPCPAPIVWSKLAAGVMDAAEAESLTLHASECPDCAEALRSSVDALADEAEESEGGEPEERLDLPSIAARMAAQPRRARWMPWAVGIAASLAVLAAGWSLWPRWNAAPLATLARASANPRLLEYRIEDAPHAPLRIQRGADAGTLSPELLESQAQVLRALAGGQMRTDWLHARGRIEFLRGDFDAAIRSLQMAADLGASSSAFLIDFGIAYAARADAQAIPVDYMRAMEHFSAALEKDPKNPEALFNRAMVEVKLSLLDPAIRDLEACAVLETDPAWRTEVNKRIEELRRKRSSLFDRGEPKPEEIATESAFERRLREGIWTEGAQAAADELKRRHGDEWLAQALTAPRDAAATRAAGVLSSMASIRSKSRREAYATLETELRWLRSASLPPTLASWREFELLVRESNRHDKALCLAQWRRFQGWAGWPFHWFQAQAALEVSTCLSAQGDLDGADRAVEAAVRLATGAKYRIAAIRAKGFHASHLVNEGRFREAVALTQEALGEIITHRLPLDRAHQFYRNLARSAEGLQCWHTAQSASHMSIAIARATELKTLALYGQLELAGYSLRAGNRVLARGYLRDAELAAGGLNSDAETQMFRDYSAALIHALEGAHAPAASIEERLLAGRNLFLDAPYLNTMAELELRLGRAEEARAHARESIQRLLAVDGATRRFRQQYAEAVELLVRAHVAMGDHEQGLLEWREWRKREHDLIAGRAFPESSSDTGLPTVSIVPLGQSLGVFYQHGSDVEFWWSDMTAGKGLELVRRLRALCSNPQSDSALIVEAADRLTTGLAGNRMGLLQGRIRLEAAGEWSSIPLLILSPGNPSLDVAYQTPAHSRAPCPEFRGNLMLAQADRVSGEFNGALPRLPFLEEERKLLERTVPGTTVRSGEALTPAVMAEAGLHFRRLHFSGHAVSWRGATMLVMAPDLGAASEEEQRGLFGLRSPARVCSDLVFFAACSSGLYHETQTVAPGHLAEAAIQAGARTAVAALWDVDAIATTELAASFYRNLSAGMGAPAALSRAASMLRSDRRYAHPYYWGAFVVFES